MNKLNNIMNNYIFGEHVRIGLNRELLAHYPIDTSDLVLKVTFNNINKNIKLRVDSSRLGFVKDKKETFQEIVIDLGDVSDNNDFLNNAIKICYNRIIGVSRKNAKKMNFVVIKNSFVEVDFQDTLTKKTYRIKKCFLPEWTYDNMRFGSYWCLWFMHSLDLGKFNDGVCEIGSPILYILDGKAA